MSGVANPCVSVNAVITLLSCPSQLIQSPVTTPLGLIMLKTTSEELACPREDLSVARKEELRKLLLDQVQTVLGLLTGMSHTCHPCATGSTVSPHHPELLLGWDSWGSVAQNGAGGVGALSSALQPLAQLNMNQFVWSRAAAELPSGRGMEIGFS